MTQNIPHTLRPATVDDSDFLYQLILETMQQYVIETWGAWDEALARTRSVQHASSPYAKVILVGDALAGLIASEHHNDYIDVQQLYLLPPFQRNGLGTRLMKQVLAEAAALALPVRLQVLRVNPARRFYERLGFIARTQTQQHIVMEVPAVANTNNSVRG